MDVRRVIAEGYAAVEVGSAVLITDGARVITAEPGDLDSLKAGASLELVAAVYTPESMPPLAEFFAAADALRDLVREKYGEA